MGKLNSSSASDGQKLEKEEKEDDTMEQKQMEEKIKRKKIDKQACEMEKEIDSRKGRDEDKAMHESEEEVPNTSQIKKRKKKQVAVPSSKRRTRQNTALPSWNKDIDPNNPLPL